MVCCLTITLGACRGTPEQSMTEVENGPFKILVRSQEFHHSAIRNIDICVAETSSRKFPKDEVQCFLHGYDFSALSVKWREQRGIQVAFRSGRVSYFRNYAFVYPKGPVPEEFHITLCEGCDMSSKDAQGMLCNGETYSPR